MQLTANDGRRKRFEQHRRLLPYDDKTIAEKLKMSDRRFAAHVTGQRPITMAFITKFYDEYIDEIVALLEKRPPPIDELMDSADPLLNKRVDELEQSNNILQTSVDRVRMELDRLGPKIDQFVDSFERIEKAFRQAVLLPYEKKKGKK
jgi:hypothetical protein